MSMDSGCSACETCSRTELARPLSWAAISCQSGLSAAAPSPCGTQAGGSHEQSEQSTTILCYAMLCYAMLCYAMLCYAMLCYAMLCYAMLCYAMLCYAMLCSLHVTITCLLVHVPRCQHGRGMLLTDAQRCPCALLRVVGGAVMQALDAGGRDACVTCRAVMQPFGACMSMST